MADDSRIARVSRFSRIWWKSRADAGLSQEEMAIGLGVSKKTIQNWEKGISAPDLFQGSEWFRLLGLNPMPYYLEFVYPTLFSDFSPDKSDAEIEDALIHLIRQASPKEKRELLFLMAGKHGSSWFALLQMFTAHCHTSMQCRVSTAPAALLRDPSLMTLFAGDNSGIQSKFLTVNAAVPKFDIASEHELSDTLKSLGITNAFSPETADFSALSDGDAVLSSIQHAARMTIDEEGATAAAFTVAMEEGAAMPPEEETDFILNRPFVVAITTRDGLPLFLGIVNTPS